MPVVEPEGTDIVAGTVTFGAESEAMLTVKPAGGAAEPIVTVPVIVPPPYAGLGAIENPVKTIGFIVRVAVAAVPVVTAEIVEVAAAFAVCTVDTVNVPVLDPEAMVIDDGTVAFAVLLEVRVTLEPPVGAFADRVTVPVDE